MTGRRVTTGGQMGTDEGMDASADAMPVEDRAYQLHCRGFGVRQIGRMLGIDKDTAQRYVSALRKEYAGMHRRNVTRWTNDAVERLHEVQRAAWTQHGLTGDVGALNTIIHAEERIARLRGIAEPEGLPQGGLTVKVEFVNDWRKLGNG